MKGIMKHMGLLVALAVLALVSCERNNPDGDESTLKIKVDKSQISFPAEGGEQTVTMTNYSLWAINGGYEDMVFEDGKWTYVNYVSPKSSSGEATYSSNVLDGGWYHATIPDKGRAPKLSVTVDKNEGKARWATVVMTVGELSTDIKIYQAAK